MFETNYFCPSSINTYRIARFEGGRRFPTTDIRKTVGSHSSMFFPCPRADGGYYNVRHVAIRKKLVWEFAFQNSSNLKAAYWSRYFPPPLYAPSTTTLVSNDIRLYHPLPLSMAVSMISCVGRLGRYRGRHLLIGEFWIESVRQPELYHYGHCER